MKKKRIQPCPEAILRISKAWKQPIIPGTSIRVGNIIKNDHLHRLWPLGRWGNKTHPLLTLLHQSSWSPSLEVEALDTDICSRGLHGSYTPSTADTKDTANCTHYTDEENGGLPSTLPALPSVRRSPTREVCRWARRRRSPDNEWGRCLSNQPQCHIWGQWSQGVLAVYQTRITYSFFWISLHVRW